MIWYIDIEMNDEQNEPNRKKNHESEKERTEKSGRNMAQKFMLFDKRIGR